MGAPTSSNFLKIYLQYFKYTKIIDILTKHLVNQILKTSVKFSSVNIEFLTLPERYLSYGS
jgi:hypothetical protein